MFLFSKLIVLSSFTLGTIGLSLYLIPLALRGNNPKINSLFKEFESLYKTNDLSEFDESEKKILEKLNDLFKAFSGAVEYSNDQKNLMSSEIEKFLDSTSNKENLLIKIYQANLGILLKLSKLFEELSKLIESKMRLESQIVSIDHSKNLVDAVKKFLEPWQKHLGEFICNIDRTSYQEKENSCKKIENVEERSSTEGGAVPLILKKVMEVEVLRNL